MARSTQLELSVTSADDTASEQVDFRVTLTHSELYATTCHPCTRMKEANVFKVHLICSIPGVHRLRCIQHLPETRVMWPVHDVPEQNSSQEIVQLHAT